MSSRFAIAFILAASLATAAPWSKLNPFKGKSKDKQQAQGAPAKTGKAASTATAKKAETPVKAQPAPKVAKAKKPKEEKPKTYTGIFTSGSVAAIPSQTEGRLDLNDPELFRFQYGKPTWALAWARIRTITVGEKNGPEPLLKIPKLTKRMRVFTLEFDDAGFVEFEIPVQDSYAVLPLLEQRSGKAVALSNANTPGGWWGDGVWKTSRNATMWDEAAKKTTLAQKD
jgi:hypothetical protein